jgi:protein-disulfide isomerase
MPLLSSRFLGALALAALLAGSAGACARSDARASAGASTVVATAGGDVASKPAAAGLSGLTDSISTMADRGRIRGAEAAPVWLIEISDFQCPYCKRWHDEVFDTIDKEYVQTGKVRLAYLNFPLSSIHPNARAASEAAMCASVQGKFWELHGSLFATQAAWQGQKDPLPTFDSLAVAAKVDPVAWRRCMSAHETAKLIDADHDRSSTAGVKSTPTFFVGDRALEGAYPVDSFRVAIDQALLKASAKR